MTRTELEHSIGELLNKLSLENLYQVEKRAVLYNETQEKLKAVPGLPRFFAARIRAIKQD